MPVLFAYFSFCQLWLSIPLVAAFSFVYAATRHEDKGPILQHAARIGFWTLFFLAVIFGILYLMSL